MVPEIDLQAFAAAQADGAVVLDVREPEEYAGGHVPGAQLAPLATLHSRVDELPGHAPVYVICASGNRSYTAAELLRSAGVDALSVAGGTQGWISQGRPVVRGAHATTPPLIRHKREENRKVQIIPIETPSLGDRSYLVHDGQVAFVVDPQRDIDRVVDLAERLGVAIQHVFETHMHNDYVTGGLALAQLTGAAYHVSGEDRVEFEREPLWEGDVVQVSPSLSLRAIATPGHTFTHLSYSLTADGKPAGVFTGGSLLYGSTGRPDLLGQKSTDELVHAQFRSAHRLAAELPDETEVFPTHGFGSFCSATQTSATSSTIGVEKQVNAALTGTEATFVSELLAGLDVYPAYYAYMGAANADPPTGAPDLSPPALADAADLHQRIERGEWVVDLRDRTAFAAAHVVGTLNFGLDGSFATYVGWLIPWGTPLTLLGETPEQLVEAQRELVRIGIDRPAAAAAGGPEHWAGERPPHSFAVATFPDLSAAMGEPDIVVLDVRRNLEWADGRIVGAVHIPLHELSGRLSEIPRGRVWVHCGSGYRASIAASLLAAADRDVVAVDDDFDHAGKADLEIVDTQELRV